VVERSFGSAIRGRRRHATNAEDAARNTSRGTVEESSSFLARIILSELWVQANGSIITNPAHTVEHIGPGPKNAIDDGISDNYEEELRQDLGSRNNSSVVGNVKPNGGRAIVLYTRFLVGHASTMQFDSRRSCCRHGMVDKVIHTRCRHGFVLGAGRQLQGADRRGRVRILGPSQNPNRECRPGAI